MTQHTSVATIRFEATLDTIDNSTTLSNRSVNADARFDAVYQGVVSDAKGNVFFTDQPSDRILEWSLDGGLSTFMQPCGRANGLCFDTIHVIGADQDLI